MAMAMIPSLALFATCIAAIWSCNGNAIIASAASPSPVPSAADCSAVVYEMLPCMAYLTIGSTMANASKACCTAVEDVLKKNAECMCDAFKSSGSMGIQLNLTRAFGLSSACAISIPLPYCGITPPPGMAPAPAPRSAAPAPAPSTRAPAPAPSTRAPAPAPSTRAPAPAPSTSAPAPSPTRNAPTPAPVNPPSPATPAPGVSPSNAPSSPPAPLGPSSEDSPAPAPTPSHAPSFTISSNLIVPLLLTLLASFRPIF